MSSSELIKCIRERGTIEEVRRILASPGVDVNQKCDRHKGNTALAYCYKYIWAYYGTYGPDVVQLLIEHGADVNAINYYNESVLIEFIRNYCGTDYIECLLSTGVVDVTCKGMFGLTPMHHCSRYDFVNGKKMIKLLKRAGGSRDLLNVLDDYGHTPFMRFIQLGAFVGLVKLVYDEKMDINLKDVNGNTALHLCSNTDTLRFLLAKNANLNLVNNDNLTPLMKIMKERPNLDMIKLMVYEGAVIDHKACFRSCYQYGKSINHLNALFKLMLLNKHANVNEVVELHRSLMKTYKRGYKPVVKDIEEHLAELGKLKTTRLTEDGDLTLYDFCVETNKKILGSHFSRFYSSVDIFAECEFPLFRDVIDVKLDVGHFWCEVLFKTDTLCLTSLPLLPGVKGVTLNSHFIERLIVPYLDDSDLLNLIKAAEYRFLKHL